MNNMNYIYKNIKGVTLIELLVAIAIAGMLIIVITRIFVLGNQKYSFIERELAERRDIAQIAEKIKMNLIRNKKILTLNTTTLIVWSADKNNDKQMQSDEVVKFIYANGELKIINGIAEQTKKLEKFKFYTDCGLPETNHVIIKIESKNRGKSIFLDTSICINSNRKIKL